MRFETSVLLLAHVLDVPGTARNSDQVPFGDQFAVSMAAGRDLNGDGVPDIVIADTTDLNEATIWFVSGRDGAVLARHTAPGNWASVEFVGDIDGDGRSEVGVGFGAWEGAGFLEILSGKSASTIRGLSAEQLGAWCLLGVRAAGSVDQDGCPDLLVGCAVPEGPDRGLGAVLVLSGKDGHVIWRLVDSHVPWRIVGKNRSCYSGMSFAGIGDVDQDDTDDIAVSDFAHDTPASDTLLDARVVVYSGRTGQPMFEIPAGKKEPNFGCTLDGGSDFDGDLRPDILVGSTDPYEPPRVGGNVRVYSGRDGSLLRSLVRPTPSERLWDEDSFGEVARFIGDLNGDSHPDLIVGAPEDGAFWGTAYVLSGLDGKALHLVEGHCDGQKPGEPDRGDHHVGRTLSRAGDVDRDGTEDFVVGNCPCDRLQFGLVRVFSGKSGKLLLSIDRESLLHPKPIGSASR